MQITVEPLIHQAAPLYAGCMIVCSVRNSVSDTQLWKAFDVEIESFRSKYVVEDINKLPGIYEMRQLYRKLGKDPNRYRPSAEALCRRILKEKTLYRINTLVDLINLVSVRTGFSIGGFDLEKVQGALTLGVGQVSEPFDAIGRGALNIEGLPVYRDAVGGIGTPTSDVERTKISLETTRLLMIINSAGGLEKLKEHMLFVMDFLNRFSEASNEQVSYFYKDAK
jgi:DNA/RNA-binding domain of Phe-tRNA-synthetase-like protein